MSYVLLLTLILNGVYGSPIHKEVLILGAGMSGVSCASDLVERGLEDYLILEADNRVGGRMRNHDFGGIPIELGANWIEGMDGSPLWDLKEEYNLQGSVTNFSDAVVYDHNFNRIPFPEGVRWVEFNNAMVYANNLSDTMNEGDLPDISIRVALKLGGWCPRTPVDHVIEWSALDFEFSEAPEITSLENGLPLEMFEQFSPQQFMVTDPRGYKVFVEHFVDNLDRSRILLNTTVTDIYWMESPIRVVTASGVEYTGTNVVSTFSLGVLQDDLVKFHPVLPLEKRKQIFKYDMSVYTKIFLKFEYAFWDDKEFFMYADYERGRYPYWQNLNLPKYFPGSNMLMVTVVAEHAKLVENQPLETTKREIMSILRSIYGDAIPDIKDIVVPVWYNDPLFKGSYSNWPIGLTVDDVEVLRAPLNNALHFAGEATTLDSGYVLSALWSGKRVAEEIVLLRGTIE